MGLCPCGGTADSVPCIDVREEMSLLGLLGAGDTDAESYSSCPGTLLIRGCPTANAQCCTRCRVTPSTDAASMRSSATGCKRSCSALVPLAPSTGLFSRGSRFAALLLAFARRERCWPNLSSTVVGSVLSDSWLDGGVGKSLANRARGPVLASDDAREELSEVARLAPVCGGGGPATLAGGPVLTSDGALEELRDVARLTPACCGEGPATITGEAWRGRPIKWSDSAFLPSDRDRSYWTPSTTT
jgi:hypothetical protein